MTVIQIDPLTDPRWQTLIRTKPSTIFHSPAWIRAVVETYQFDAYALLLLDAHGQPQAGFPVCPVQDMRGKRLIIFPFSDYYDPLVANADEWRTLINVLLEQQVPIRIRCLHNEVPLHDERFRLFNKTKWHGMDIGADQDQLWQHLDPACRRAIHKAEGCGLSIRHAHDQATMRQFFDLHLSIRKYKYRLLAQPYRFFEKIWEYLVEPGHGTLLTVQHGDQIVSAALYLRWQQKLYYKFSASRRDALSLRPNDLLVWEGIKYGKSLGNRYLDLGLSDWDQDGLIAFKRKFATHEKTISFLQYQPTAAASQPSPPAELLPTLTQLFTDPSVPDLITEKAGELLYRFFV